MIKFRRTKKKEQVNNKNEIKDENAKKGTIETFFRLPLNPLFYTLYLYVLLNLGIY